MDKGKYNSVLMAKYIVAIANGRAIPINMTKTQKLLYIAYGTYLAVSNDRLVNEHPQAWPFGPVFPTTRNRLLKTDLYAINIKDLAFSDIKEDKEVQELLNLVFSTFGSWTASQLTAWSHGNGTPWERTVYTEGFKWGNTMDDNIIKAYFKSIIRDKDED